MSSEELKSIVMDVYKERAPDNTLCDALSFSFLVDRLETVDKNRAMIPSKQDMLAWLLPRDLFQHLQPNGSGYPYVSRGSGRETRRGGEGGGEAKGIFRDTPPRRCIQKFSSEA